MSDMFSVTTNGELSLFAGMSKASFVIDVRVEDATDSSDQFVSSEIDVSVMEVTQHMLNHMMTVKLIG